MAPASEQFEPSDISFWGIIALACGAFAVVAANVGALLPVSVVASLHSSRIEGAGIEQLQTQVVRLQSDSQLVYRENEQLRARFELAEEDRGMVTRRVGALEVALPNLLEERYAAAGVDRSINTSGIGQSKPVTFDAEGGSVSVSQRPLVIGVEQPPAPEFQAMPKPVATVLGSDDKAFGLAIGSAVTNDNVAEAWKDMSNKMGALVMGLGPLIADDANSSKKRLVVGPINNLSEASDLCRRIEKVAVSCLPVPFIGTPL